MTQFSELPAVVELQAKVEVVGRALNCTYRSTLPVPPVVLKARPWLSAEAGMTKYSALPVVAAKPVAATPGAKTCASPPATSSTARASTMPVPLMPTQPLTSGYAVDFSKVSIAAGV